LQNSIQKKGAIEMPKNIHYEKRWGISLEEAKQLTYGDYIYSNQFTNADNKTPKRWKVNGQIKLWKRNANRIQIPVKYGLYNHAYLCSGTISNKVYMNSITLELRDHELTDERAIEVLKEKEILEPDPYLQGIMERGKNKKGMI
jgi:hypothetical protein